VELAADPRADVPGAPWQVPKRYVHTLTKSRLWRVHSDLTAEGLTSPFGDADLPSPDALPFGTPDDQVTTVRVRGRAGGVLTTLTWLLAIGGALILLLVYRLVLGRRGSPTR
jgi:hypothetical protein